MENLPANAEETWVRSLGWEDALEKEEATHSLLDLRTNWTCKHTLGTEFVHMQGTHCTSFYSILPTNLTDTLFPDEDTKAQIWEEIS